jgi:WD40 repeat protein
MKMRSAPVIFPLLLVIAACQPVDSQPRFTSWTGMTATSIPVPPTPPRLAASLPERIQSFDISPDLSTIALATTGGVGLYDLKTLKYLRTLNEKESVVSLAWSHDGKKLAAGTMLAYPDHGAVRLVVWDTSSWQVVFEPDFGRDMDNERILDIAWSPDDRSLAFSADIHGVSVLEMRSGGMLSHQKDFAGSVVDISWSPDGSRLVSTGDMAYAIRRWRISDDEAVRLFDRRVSNSMQVAWSPDGKRIASGHAYGGVCIWTAATNRCDGYIRAHRTAVFSLAWSPDGGRLATGGGVIRIWDTQTGGLITAFGEEDGAIYSHLEWLADGTIVSLSVGFESPENTLVQFWDVTNGSVRMEFRGTKTGE